MSVRIDKNESVWTVILSRHKARNAIDPESAEALYEAFTEFDQEDSASVAVLLWEGAVARHGTRSLDAHARTHAHGAPAQPTGAAWLTAVRTYLQGA